MPQIIARFKGLLDVMRCRNQVQENRHYWGGPLGLTGTRLFATGVCQTVSA